MFLDNLGTGLALTLFGTGLGALVLPALVGGAAAAARAISPLRPGDAGLLPARHLAAWLALIELVRAPERWNKTRHGPGAHLPKRRLRHHGMARGMRAAGRRAVS